MLKWPINPKFKIIADDNGIIDKSPHLNELKNIQEIINIMNKESPILFSEDLTTKSTKSLQKNNHP